ncbi:MAG: SBBP repeat-containing protein [Cytophagales bacterium]|nr:SBBP repeat-containing protein [Cytophagales bacterium]
MTNYVTISAATASSLVRPARPARFFLLVLLAGLLGAPSLRAQSFAWAKRTTNSQFKSAVAADNAGNVYKTVAFSGTVTLGPYTFTSRGADDIVLVKYNASGVVQWARRIGGTGDEMAGDVSLTQYSGYVFVTGSFQNTVRFGSYHGLDASPLTSSGGSDVFVARYNASTGTLDWARKAGGTQDDYGNGIAVDGSDNVYVTGGFYGSIYFSTGFLVFPLNSLGISDIFLAKYNVSGTLQMSRRLGGLGYDYGQAVGVDKYNGEIYLTGGYAPVSNLYVVDVFVAKYTAAGVLSWNHVTGSAGTVDAGSDLVVTASGAYVTGNFGNSINFGSNTLNSSGGSDAFVAHYYYTNGPAASWAKRYGGPSWDEGQSITEFIGNLYLGGTFRGTATFGHNTVNAAGGASDQDLFVTRLFGDGTPVWTWRIGGTGYDYGRGGLAVPTTNAIYFAGSYGAAMTLGGNSLPGSGSLLTKITPPVQPNIAGFRLINAGTDADLGNLPGSAEINYLTLGTNQINIKVNTNPGTVGSVKLNLDGVVKTENAAPYTWAGDSPKAGGGTNYLSFTPSLGTHRLEATAYSGANGTGVRGTTTILFFTVVNQPVITSLTLFNAATDASLGTLTNGQNINFAGIGTNQINIRANTNPGTVGSVRFNLDGVIRTENAAPYTYAGDAPKSGGGTNYLPFTPSVGYHNLVVTPYSGVNGTGTAGKPYEVYFYVQTGAGRLEAEGPEPETDATSLTAAPNPFAGRTTLTFTAPEDGPARLEVYSPAGTRTRLLFEGQVESGKTYQHTFDGTALPPGLYVGRLTTGGKVSHRKLLLGQ